MRYFAIPFAAIVCCCALGGCGDEEKGPMQKTGEAIDKAAVKTGEAIDKAAVKTDEAVDKAVETVKDAAK